MTKDLEKMIRDFRERAMGKELSEKYPFSLEGGTVKYETLSWEDNIIFLLKFFGKLTVPLYGDKLMIDWVRLEIELNPEKEYKYILASMFLLGKYASLFVLLDKIF